MFISSTILTNLLAFFKCSSFCATEKHFVFNNVFLHKLGLNQDTAEA